MGGSQSSIHVYYRDNKLIKETTTGSSTNTESIPIKEINNIEYTNEEWNKIKSDGKKEIDFCILDNNTTSILECINLFKTGSNDTTILDQYRIVKSNSDCWSYFYRPGSCIEKENVNKAIEIFGSIVKGNKCQIEYQDYTVIDSDLIRCCYEKDYTKCNKNLINDYTTNHCNVIMKEKCKNDIYNENCIRWLEQTVERENDDLSALELYSDWCKDHFDDTICDYLCKISRNDNDYKCSFCDKSLIVWCNKNKNNSNCNCVLTPNNIIPEVESYLGPKECWLTACSSQSNNKWLTTEQLKTRGNCQLTSCSINIDSLTLNDNAKAQLINDCIQGIKTSSKIIITKNKKEDIIEKIPTPGYLFSPELGIIFLSLSIITYFL